MKPYSRTPLSYSIFKPDGSVSTGLSWINRFTIPRPPTIEMLPLHQPPGSECERLIEFPALSRLLDCFDVNYLHVAEGNAKTLPGFAWSAQYLPVSPAQTSRVPSPA